MNIRNTRKGVCLALIAMSIVFIAACKKDTQKGAGQFAPVLHVDGAYAASPTSIIVQGDVQSGYPLTSFGVFWTTFADYPNNKHLVAVSGNAVNGIEGTITNLSPNSTYYVGVYATNSIGTSYYFYTAGLITTPAQ
jgi:hypothetical protein